MSSSSSSSVTKTPVVPVKHYSIDNKDVESHPLTKALVEAYEIQSKLMPDDNNMKKLCVITAIELILSGLGVERKRIVNGFLGEVVISASSSVDNPEVLNSKLQGHDAVTADDKRVEYKHTNAEIGHRTNVNFTLPKYNPREHQSLSDYFDKFTANTLQTKGDRITIVNRYTGGQQGYELSMSFYCFMVRAKFHQEKTIPEKLNIGGTSCNKCKRIHRIDRLIQIEEEWTKEPDSTQFSNANLVKYKKIINKEVVAQCQ
jgi:hypothetical protein